MRGAEPQSSNSRRIAEINRTPVVSVRTVSTALWFCLLLVGLSYNILHSWELVHGYAFSGAAVLQLAPFGPPAIQYFPPSFDLVATDVTIITVGRDGSSWLTQTSYVTHIICIKLEFAPKGKVLHFLSTF